MVTIATSRYTTPVSDPRLRLCIESECAPLEAVLVHRPGDEVVRMTQHDLAKMLFDDILSPQQTMREHDLMTEIMRHAGTRVLSIADLLERALERAPRHARHELVRDVCALAKIEELAGELLDQPPKVLCDALICGLRRPQLDLEMRSLSGLRQQLLSGGDVALNPQPNLMFMRDPCITVGEKVLIGGMATHARAREPWLVSFAVEYSDELYDPHLLGRGREERHGAYRNIEGGDVLVLSSSVLMIGCSERTSAQTIERVTRGELFPAIPSLERVYAVFMPEQRSVMHLDTILTQIDERLFLGHQPLLTHGERALPVARVERDKPAAIVANASVLDVLREEFGADVQLVPCGGDDPLFQEREQWSDGANAVCIAPGRIILYARNVNTIATLREQHGFAETPIHMVQPAEMRRELVEEGMKNARTVFSFPGNELSRARGGGRCLTMPLRRRKAS